MLTKYTAIIAIVKVNKFDSLQASPLGRIPASRFDRGVSLRTGGGGGSHTDAPSRLITKSRSHRAAELAEKFAKNKDCVVQIQSLFAFYESLSQVRAITYFGYAEILAPTAVFCLVFQNPE